MPGSSAAPAARIRPARRRWSAAAARSGADLPGAPARTGGSSLGALRCKTTGDVLKDLEKMGKSIETPFKNQMSWLWWLWSWFHSGKNIYFLMEKNRWMFLKKIHLWTPLPASTAAAHDALPQGHWQPSHRLLHGRWLLSPPAGHKSGPDVHRFWCRTNGIDMGMGENPGT